MECDAGLSPASAAEREFEEALAVLIHHAEQQAQGWTAAYADFDALRAAHRRAIQAARADTWGEAAAMIRPFVEQRRGFYIGIVADLSEEFERRAKEAGK